MYALLQISQKILDVRHVFLQKIGSREATMSSVRKRFLREMVERPVYASWVLLCEVCGDMAGVVVGREVKTDATKAQSKGGTTSGKLNFK